MTPTKTPDCNPDATASFAAPLGSADSCLFCESPRQLKPGCQKQRWMVCGSHFMVTCPKCGHEAFWMEKMKSGRSYYSCFRVEPWCNWTSETPPNESSSPTAADGNGGAERK